MTYATIRPTISQNSCRNRPVEQCGCTTEVRRCTAAMHGAGTSRHLSLRIARLPSIAMLSRVPAPPPETVCLAWRMMLNIPIPKTWQFTICLPGITVSERPWKMLHRGCPPCGAAQDMLEAPTSGPSAMPVLACSPTSGQISSPTITVTSSVTWQTMLWMRTSRYRQPIRQAGLTRSRVASHTNPQRLARGPGHGCAVRG